MSRVAMIRVIYHWKVVPGREQDFAAAWSAVTRVLQATTAGAGGSILMRSHSDPLEFIAMARWDSLEAWQAFHHAGPPSAPELKEASAAMKAASAGGLASWEIYDELDHQGGPR
jgi:heme-degrading monooxygenase HmoA